MKKSVNNLTKLDYKKIAETNNNQLKNEYKIDYLGNYSSNRKLREKEFGKNLNIQEKFNYFWEYLKRYFEPFNLLLLTIGCLELILYFFVTHKLIELISFFMIIFMIILATTVDYIHELKARKINKDIDAVIENKYHVLNDFEYDNNLENVLNKLKPIYEHELLCGDILYLTKGDIVPADCKILAADDLYIDQSSLSGESEPIKKKKSYFETNDILNLSNILYSQTNLVNGKCLALVIGVGKNKYSSIISNNTKNSEPTNYEKGLKSITKKIIFLILCAIPVMFVVFGIKTSDWVSGLVLALATGIALIPESLSAIISSNLQYGVKKLRNKNVIVKNSQSMQTLGAVDVLATDKTGTLTKDQITIKGFYNLANLQDSEVEKLAYLNAKYQSNITSVIDGEIVKKLEDKIQLNDNIKFLKEIQFSQTTRMSTIELIYNSENWKISKGSVIEILKACQSAYLNNEIVEINDSLRNDILSQQKQLNEQGLMTLLIMVEKNGLSILYGYIILQNELKEHVEQTVQLLYKNNIDLKIVTGDNQYVSSVVANQVKLKNVNICDGVNDDLTEKNLVDYSVFTKLDPIQKGLVIQDHKEKNKVIAYLGDGLNDVVALSKADVGISVNNAKPITKNQSDIILMEKDLRVLEEAFLLGRSIFTNAIKFIKITITCNFGLLMAILLSIILFNFEAMSPLQLLMQNLIYDFANLIYIFDKVDPHSTVYPCKWKTNTFIKFSVWNGLVPFIISTINFMVIAYGLNLKEQIDLADSDQKVLLIAQFQTMFFLESLITHMLMIFILRTEKISFIQSWPSIVTSISIVLFIGFGLFLGLTPKVNSSLGFNFDFNYAIWFAYLLAILIGCWIIGEVFKKVYIRVFKSWI